MTAALHRRRKGRGPRWAAAAALVGAAAAAWLLLPGGELQPVPGQILRTEAIAQQVALGPHGVQVGPHSELAVEPQSQGQVRLRLNRGAVECRVERLRPGQTFEVATERLRVAVVGTRFRVEEGPRCSRVRVDEGVVQVTVGDRSLRLVAGQAREVCGSDGLASDSATDAPATPLPEREPEPEPPAEADLMRRALDALADGRTDEARQALRRVRALHPEGAFVADSLFHQATLEHRVHNDVRARQLLLQLERLEPDSMRVQGLQDLLGR